MTWDSLIRKPIKFSPLNINDSFCEGLLHNEKNLIKFTMWKQHSQPRWKRRRTNHHSHLQLHNEGCTIG